jgi:drug/metabolite transporter (DMT)-like permease
MAYAAMAAALWGLSPILLKHLAAATSPHFVTTAMYVIAALVLAPWAIPSVLKLPRRLLVSTAACAVLVTAMFNLVLAHMAAGVTGTTIAAIVALEPAIIMLISSVLARKAPHARQLLGLAISTTGVLVLLVVQGVGAQAGQSAVAVAAVLVAAIAWSAGVVWTGRLPPCDSEFERALQIVFLGSAPFLLLLDGSVLATAVALESAQWLELLFLALLSTIAANALWCMAIQRLGATRAGGFVNLIPVVSVLASHAVLGETLTAPMTGALVITMSGIYFFSRAKR